MFSIGIFHSVEAFQRYQIYLILPEVQQVTIARKISLMKKKSDVKYGSARLN